MPPSPPASSSGGEWSDPGEEEWLSCTGSREGSSNGSGGGSERDDHRGSEREPSGGIAIPAFLQPLLGLDLIPCRPAQSDEERGVTAVDDAIRERPFDEKKCGGEVVGSSIFDGNEFRRETVLDIGASLDHLALPTPSPRTNVRRLSGRVAQALRRRPSPRTTVPNRKHFFKSRHSFHEEPIPRRHSGGRALDWLAAQRATLAEHQKHLSTVQAESVRVQGRAAEIESRVTKIQKEATRLQEALARSMKNLKLEVDLLRSTNDELRLLEDEAIRAAENVEATIDAMKGGWKRSASASPALRPPLGGRRRSKTEDSGSWEELTPVAANAPLSIATGMKTDDEVAVRRYANTDGLPRPLRHSDSCSFVRVNDLQLRVEGDTSSLSSSTRPVQPLAAPPSPLNKDLAEAEIFFIDHNLSLILERLSKLGYAVVTDESDRFAPTRETQRLLSKYGDNEPPVAERSLHPWMVPKDNDVLLWTGGVDHEGFGHDWPVVKARGIVRKSPRELLDFLLDSSQIKKYNKMSQGREDVLILQEGVDCTADESPYGFAGAAKITRALAKPMLFPKTIEMLSLWYTKPLRKGAYMIVSRSVWEDDSGSHQRDQSRLRIEMLLGVQLLRPCPAGCELTTITHVHSPGMPEVLAKRSAPGNAANMIREIQALFPQS